MIAIREYVDPEGRSPYAGWFDRPNARAAAKTATALARLEQGNLSRVKGVGAGAFEYRIAFAPGYRIYLGWDGDALVILLGGGTEQRQQQDIQTARDRWQDYKRRKRREAWATCP